MARAYRDYSERHDMQAEGFNDQTPTAGFYRFRMRSGGMLVGVRIWHGQPADPVTGEPLDRALRWQAMVNGAPVDLERVWPACGRDPTTEAEYLHLCRFGSWMADATDTTPRERIDPLSSPLLI